MSRRISLIAALGTLLALTAACTNKKSVNPLAGVGSKQPDKVLFDKAMEAMRRNRFDVARLTLQTLINTYPDSEYIARAKLAVGDSWYAEGGTAALAQAEQEYSDFQIFFPNMPEAAEAQFKIANIHYQQMEKADRDYTHAKRAEDEYRKAILQYPDNTKIVSEAKKRLLEVQEVLAEREFDIGRFYYLRESYPASIARLQSLADKYPLYSRVDEALYLLGQNYEGQITRTRTAPTCDAHGLPRGCMPEAVKSKYIGEFTKRAAVAYDKIVTRYPMMDRSDDARKRLTALHQAVPRPTKGAVAQNKAEIASRSETSMTQRFMGVIKKGPDVARAATVGEPTLVDPDPVAANQVIRNETFGAAGLSDKTSIGVEVVKQPGQGDAAVPSTTDANSPTSPFARPAGTEAPPAADPNELKPSAPAADPNELKPADSGADPSLPPPVQVNEIQQEQSSSAATKSTDDSAPASDQDLSSSKKKHKKGLEKLNPF
ncbi:MAG TPA: outer membrane protein assembly factor BamD [Candidatus Sulfotelmatobacter sp.]|jgi:outer membrane protein assembly factor BamD|nr:outer membrane protein assembly factor BamD [Candidatus Sulfotelmatobacter sp.]